ncbi:MAG: hypothetical protein JWN78_398 [Bacteroidota bacterium]|nr:hypothetical protein [Bacteroidota bacterium]
MAHGLFIISTTFIDKNEMVQKMEAISSIMGMYLSADDEYNIDIWIPEEITLKILFQSQDRYNELKADGYWGEGYGPLFSITVIGKWRCEDETTFPFVKAFLKEYPDLLVFNEEIPGGKPLTYTKENLDAMTGNNTFASVFTQPPQENLT